MIKFNVPEKSETGYPERNSIMKHLGKILYFASCFLLMGTTAAHAYIDPSLSTFIIQVVAGVAIAVGAVFTIYWRKARKKVADSLGIDENANKEVEEDVVVYSKDEGQQEG